MCLYCLPWFISIEGYAVCCQRAFQISILGPLVSASLLMFCVPLQVLPYWAGRERWPCPCVSPTSCIRKPLPARPHSSPPRHHRVPHSSSHTPGETLTWRNPTCFSLLSSPSSSSPCLPSYSSCFPEWGPLPCLWTLPPSFKVWTWALPDCQLTALFCV